MQINLKDIPGWCLVTNHTIDGETLYLVRPNNSIVSSFKGHVHGWDSSNLIFRSSLWNKEGQLVSASYPKFFNLDERTDIHPFTGDLTNTSLIEKIDGSTLIVSKYHKKIIARTRGTVDARTMPNGHEIELFLKKFENSRLNIKELDTWDFSYIFEWVSPLNKIVISYPEPDFYYTNCIEHFGYYLSPQSVLDYEVEMDAMETKTIWKRPKRYTFNNLNELVGVVKSWPGTKEGIVLYYDNDQHMVKIKSLDYLKLHAFKSHLTIRSIVDLYYDIYEMPDTEDLFFKKIVTDYDFECAEYARPLIHALMQKVDWLKKEIDKLTKFVNRRKKLLQKDFAEKILQLIHRNLTGFAFSIRKGTFKFKDTKKYILNLLQEGEHQ